MKGSINALALLVLLGACDLDGDDSAEEDRSGTERRGQDAGRYDRDDGEEERVRSTPERNDAGSSDGERDGAGGDASTTGDHDGGAPSVGDACDPGATTVVGSGNTVPGGDVRMLPAIPPDGIASPVDTIIGDGNVTSDAKRPGCTYRGPREVRGNGQLVMERRPVASFTGLRVSGDVNSELSVGAPSVLLNVDANLVPLIASDVKDAVLTVQNRNRGQSLIASPKARVQIAAPQLEAIDVLGEGTLRGTTSASALKLRVSDEGHLALELSAKAPVSVEAKDDATVELAGQAATISVDAAGDAEVESTIVADSVEITAKGDASILVHAQRKVRVRASGNAVVTIRGNPAERDVQSVDDAEVDFER